MSKMTMDCADVVSIAIDGRTQELEGLFVVNKDYREILLDYCRALDILVDQFDADEFIADVDRTTNSVKTIIRACSAEVYQYKDAYYELVKRAKSFGFEYVDEDHIDIIFVFPSIWERRSDIEQ